MQLTGYSDPIYCEAIVHIHKYDITFDVFLTNRTAKVLQNISIDFTTQSDVRVLEKAPQVTLQPNQSSQLKASIKFSSTEVGLIFGSNFSPFIPGINYENTAGIEQAYLVTKEINIDLIDFIYPAEITMQEFRTMWAKYEWENRINISTNFK